VLGVVTTALANAALAAEPIRLSHGPQLLIDDYLVESQSDLKHTVCPPARLPQPVVTGPEDKCFQPFFTVLRDSTSGRFRIWYGVPESASQSHLGYMESQDGVRWIRPHRVLQDPARIQFGASILDDGPGSPNPSQRYKYGWWRGGGLQVAASPDGFVWTPTAPGVVLPHNHDITAIYRDPIRRRYGALVSCYIPGPTWKGNRRIRHAVPCAWSSACAMLDSFASTRPDSPSAPPLGRIAHLSKCAIGPA